MSIALQFAGWILVDRLILLQDQELVSSCNLVWLVMVFLWWTVGKGCPSNLVMKTNGPITFDSRSRVSCFIQVLFWAYFGVLSVDQRLRGGGS